MNKEHKLFDKKFVHFMWDDELEGKKGFIAKSVKDLKNIVNANYYKELICNSHDEEYPFLSADDNKYHFAYYDPNYEVKKAFNEGKKIQYRTKGFVDWEDYTNQNPCWDDEDREWRVKPEEEKWIVYLAREENGSCYLTACREDVWKSVQKAYGAKTKLFVGSTDVKCTVWYKAREQFADLIKAWEDGAKIQVKKTDIDAWADCDEPLWCKECQYRIKPEDKPCDDEQEKRAEPTFQEELRGLLNRFGMDNECDTPDHILRDYLTGCLQNYKIATKENIFWHNWLGLGAEADCGIERKNDENEPFRRIRPSVEKIGNFSES